MVDFYLVVAFKTAYWEIDYIEDTMGVTYAFVNYKYSKQLMEDGVDDVYIFLNPEQLRKKIDDLTDSDYQMYVKYIFIKLLVQWEKLKNES